MNIIDTTLAHFGLTQDELPKKILNKIDYLNQTLEEIELTKADLKIEEDEDTKQEMIDTLEKAEDYVKALTEEIVAIITEIGEAKNVAAPAAPAPAPTSTNSNTASASAPTEKKKGSALPWIIGGVVLVLTLGAVNVMQEK